MRKGICFPRNLIFQLVNEIIVNLITDCAGNDFPYDSFSIFKIREWILQKFIVESKIRPLISGEKQIDSFDYVSMMDRQIGDQTVSKKKFENDQTRNRRCAIIVECWLGYQSSNPRHTNAGKQTLDT